MFPCCKAAVLVGLLDFFLQAGGEQSWGSGAAVRGQRLRQSSTSVSSGLVLLLYSSFGARSSSARLWQLAGGQQIPPLHSPPAGACELSFFFHAVLSTVFDRAPVLLPDALCIPLPAIPNTVIPVFPF